MITLVRLIRFLYRYAVMKWIIYRCKLARVSGRSEVVLEWLPSTFQAAEFCQRIREAGFGQPFCSSGSDGSLWVIPI